MVGDGALEARFVRGTPSTLDKKLGQLVGLRREHVGARLPIRIALEQLGIMHAHLARA